MTDEVLTIEHVARLSDYANGSPRFRVFFTDGSASNTEPNAAVNRIIENPEWHDVPIRVTFAETGNIAYLNLLW